MKRELEILMYVDHPNIIKLYETYEDQLYLHLVMELCTGGDVCERLITKGFFSEEEAANIMKQLLSAVNYLHLNGITHRDLKPENFIYESETSDVIKICDFGMSIKTDNNFKLKSLAGTPYYLAPEVLRGSYTKSCDVWSLGVFLYFILLGRHPFKGASLESIYQKASKARSSLDIESMERISTNAKELIRLMLNVNSSRRITMKEALKHRWFETFDSKKQIIPEDVLKALCKYKAKNKLWQEAIKIAVKSMSNSQINGLREAFIAIDTEKKGFITANELQKAMKNSGFNIASDEIEKIIDNCSYIHNGKINFTEFLVATMNKKALMNEELMWEAFTYFDKKNEGKILGKDLKTALERAGCEFKDGEFEEIIREAQLEMNADIDYENFKVFMSCFEEESEVLNSNLAHITLVKRMTTDFRVQMLKAGTLGKTIEVSR
jgi:calcium-dependent protein kinase